MCRPLRRPTLKHISRGARHFLSEHQAVAKHHSQATVADLTGAESCCANNCMNCSCSSCNFHCCDFCFWNRKEHAGRCNRNQGTVSVPQSIRPRASGKNPCISNPTRSLGTRFGNLQEEVAVAVVPARRHHQGDDLQRNFQAAGRHRQAVWTSCQAYPSAEDASSLQEACAVVASSLADTSAAGAYRLSRASKDLTASS